MPKINYHPHQREIAELLRTRDGIIAHHGLGSGKTLTAINAANELGIPALAVVPASLRENFKKEMLKANPSVPIDVMSYEGFYRSRPDLSGRMLILDEAHRIKNEDSVRSKVISELSRRAKKRLLLTGTPIQNKPHDIAMLANVAAGSDILPSNETEFNSKYLRRKNKSIMDIIKKRDPGYAYTNNEEYRSLVDQYMHRYQPESSIENFPNVNYSEVPVEMSPEQYEAYKAFERGAGSDVRDIIAGASEAKKKGMGRLNSFLNKTRQISNIESSGKLSPKMQKVLENIEGGKGPSLVYSNFIGSGIDPLRAALEERNKMVGVFTGELNDARKKAIVDEYNNRKLDALLISSAGSEGLDLKGTRSVHIVEPHWNDPKINQVIGRSARYNSHSHLPVNERNVDVVRYISKRPSSFMDYFIKRPPTTDEYLRDLSLKKSEVNRMFLS